MNFNRIEHSFIFSTQIDFNLYVYNAVLNKNKNIT
jgi:hypothetical protein